MEGILEFLWKNEAESVRLNGFLHLAVEEEQNKEEQAG